MTGPPWLHPVRTTLTVIALLKPDWDSYGALAPDPWCLETVPCLLGVIMRLDTPAPMVVPLGGGGIGLEWHTVDVDLEIEVLPGRRIGVLWGHLGELDDNEWEQDYGGDLSRLRALVGQIK